MGRKDSSQSTPFSWGTFLSALASFSLFALLLGLVVGVVLGLKPLERKASQLTASVPTTIDIRWPTVPGQPSVTWIPETERASLEQLATAAVGNDSDRFSVDALERVGKAMTGSGWFQDSPPPRVTRGTGGRVVVQGAWRVPAAVVRRDGVEQLISWEGLPMPYSKPAGESRFPVIDSPAQKAPKAINGELDYSTAWAGDDIASSLELLQVLLRQSWASQVAGIDVSNYGTDHVLVISTPFGTKIVWGGRVSKPALGEVSSAQKIAHITQLFQEHKRIDAGYPMIYVNNSKLQFDISATADALAKAQEALAKDVNSQLAKVDGEKVRR